MLEKVFEKFYYLVVRGMFFKMKLGKVMIKKFKVYCDDKYLYIV